MSAAISASLVKDLREKSGAGMMECKKALEQSNGDMEKAMKALRESGAAKAAKRESRTAAEGLIGIAASPAGTDAAFVELNSETDFVARNEEFQKLLGAISQAALAAKAADAESLKGVALPSMGRTAGEAVQDLLAKIGEKITLTRAAFLSDEIVVTYLHPPGKIGVGISAKIGKADPEKVREALKNVAMHIAAMSPRFLTDAEVDQKTLDTEREIAANIARKEGKPENIIPKIVDGKIKAFYKDTCLLDQTYAIDTTKNVRAVLEEASKAAGDKITVTQFIRMKVGETAAAQEVAE